MPFHRRRRETPRTVARNMDAPTASGALRSPSVIAVDLIMGKASDRTDPLIPTENPYESLTVGPKLVTAAYDQVPR